MRLLKHPYLVNFIGAVLHPRICIVMVNKNHLFLLHLFSTLRFFFLNRISVAEEVYLGF